MDATLKAKWLEALRSGKYQQNFYNVGKGKSLCCIGVGGVVAGLKPSIHKHNSADCANALGLTDRQANKLFKMNDSDRKSFPEIADYIEQNL